MTLKEVALELKIDESYLVHLLQRKGLLQKGSVTAYGARRGLVTVGGEIILSDEVIEQFRAHRSHNVQFKVAKK